MDEEPRRCRSVDAPHPPRGLRERLDHHLARRGDPAGRGARDLRRRPLREPGRRGPGARRRRPGACSSASIATRSTAYSWEIPEGGVPAGEIAARRRPARAARGDRASRPTTGSSSAAATSPTRSRTKRPMLFLATGLTPRHAPLPKAPNRSTVRWVPFEEVLAMTLDGRITDAMTVLAVHRAAIARLAGDRRGRRRGWRMTAPERRDWDAIVVGLGAIGSGAAYWLSRPLGERVLGLEQFEFDHRQRRLGRPQPDHPPVLPPARLRPACQARLRELGGGRGRGRRADRDRHRRPRPVAGGPGDPGGRLRREPGGRGRPVRAPRRRRGHAPLAAVAARARGHRRCGSGRAGSPTRSRATPPTGGSPGRTAPRCATDVRVTAPPRRGRRRPRGRRPTPGRSGPAALVLAADAWTNQLLASFGRRLPLQVTREQVTYFACPDPAAFAPDRFPVWIWMDDPSFYGFPTYGEAGPEGRPGLRRRAGRPGPAHVRA